jgi:potassium/hydrogen antiporter
MVAGSDVTGWIDFSDAELARNLGVIALVVILFEGGLTTKPSDLRRGGAPGFLLSNLGVLITAFVTGAALLLVLDISWEAALLLGAIVASTDAAAVFDLLRRAPLPRRIAATLEVESGANDPFAVMLTIGLLAAAQQATTWNDWLVFGAKQLFGGILVGVVVGAVGAYALRTLRLRAQSLYPVLALAIAAATYGLGARIGASGFFAVYLAGLIIGAHTPRHRRIIRNFATSMANTADIALFLMLGLLVFPAQLPPVILPGLAVTAVLVFVARPAAVAVCLGPFGFTWREQAVASWAGLRGAVPIVLATFPYMAGYPEGNTIFNVVFFVVLVSVSLQAMTVVPLVRRLGLATPRPAWDEIAEALPLEVAGVAVVELTVADGLPIVGRTLAELPVPDGMRVTTLLRGNTVIVPTGATRLAVGDLALVAVDVDVDEDPATMVRRWAAP